MSEQIDDDDNDRRAAGWWYKRGPWVLVGLLLLLLAGLSGWLLGSDDDDKDILFEAAASIGPDPFTTTAVAASPPRTGSSTTDALYGGSGDIGVCDPARLVEFLQQNPDKAKAWVGALNASPGLVWSGGNKVMVSQIAAYVAELTPGFLTADTKVINHGYKNGKATPRPAVLQKGTAVLFDSNGVPRARCKCGNPLGDNGHGDPTTTTTTSSGVTTTLGSTSTTSLAGTTTTLTTDGCSSDPVPPLSAATDITTKPVDFDGDGVADVLTVYQLAGSWHVRATINGVAIDDEIVVGAGPMTAIGGATVNNDSSQEAWVKTSAMGASTDTIGLYVFRDCKLQRVLLNDGSPAEFPIGASTQHADGLTCFGPNLGIKVLVTTSTDGDLYKGTSTIYTLNLSGPSPVLVPGSVSSVSESSSTGGPGFAALSMFTCDSLANIP